MASCICIYSDIMDGIQSLQVGQSNLQEGQEEIRIGQEVDHTLHRLQHLQQNKLVCLFVHCLHNTAMCGWLCYTAIVIL